MVLTCEIRREKGGAVQAVRTCRDPAPRSSRRSYCYLAPAVHSRPPTTVPLTTSPSLVLRIGGAGGGAGLPQIVHHLTRSSKSRVFGANAASRDEAPRL